MPDREVIHWKRIAVASPSLPSPVDVVAALGVPYVEGGNRFQTLNLYLPADEWALHLVGRPIEPIASIGGSAFGPDWHVHIHGGAWRDPDVDARSVEPTVAHAFASSRYRSPIRVVASLNYTISPFPGRPSDPYDPSTAVARDPGREAVHPDHIHDVLRGLDALRRLGLRDRSYIVSGHSCGACLAFQAVLGGPARFGLRDVPEPPSPAAAIGLNGLYDLPALVEGLDDRHRDLRREYRDLLSIAFSPDRNLWTEASPALFDPGNIEQRSRLGLSPPLVILDQSPDDQLVPLNNRDRLASRLQGFPSLTVEIGHRCGGRHADPWEDGLPVWQSVQDAIALIGR